jgi:hypothetical protein
MAFGQVSGNAKKVLDAINDQELLGVIDYKTKNFKSDGKYPALKIPAPVA